MKILVTGGAGFIGKNLVKEFSSKMSENLTKNINNDTYNII